MEDRGVKSVDGKSKKKENIRAANLWDAIMGEYCFSNGKAWELAVVYLGLKGGNRIFTGRSGLQ